MYQNAPPPHAYNGGGYGAQPPPQYGGGGYYDNNNPNMGGGYNPQYGAPSPVNAAYQRANAAMTARGPSPSMNGSGPGGPGGAAGGGGGGASGLIRLTLRKPMGIVFEPMTDPHNPSQQRGVRICDLPRTGAAAMSQKLEVGDELLSINDKTMSRLTFDEIMDFIIEADKERVDLLFRRPSRNKDGGKGGGANGAPGGQAGGGHQQPMSPMALGGIGSNSNSVKWIDEKSDMGGKLTEDVRGGEADRDHRGGGGGRGSGGGGNRNKVRDDPSVDDTYNDGYTVESQSQYTMETYEDERRRGGGRGGGGRYDDDDSKQGKHSRRNGRDTGRSSRKDARSNDPVESGGFLDLLIDTLCTSVMGRDARDMCGDRSGKSKGSQAKGKYDDEDEFTVDDGTYVTQEEYDNRRGGKGGRRMDEEESLATMEEETFVTNEDDGTRTLESREVVNSKKPHHSQNSAGDKGGKDLKKSSSSGKSKSKDLGGDSMPHRDGNDVVMDSDAEMIVGSRDDNPFNRSSDPPPHHQDVRMMNTAPDPPTKAHSRDNNIHVSASAPMNNHQMQPHDMIVDPEMNEMESAMASGIALPLKELQYDDRVDYAADVSVMESLGGPSLLVERSRHENAVHSGADRASFENLDRQDPELADLVAKHGEGFVPDPGMTREETAFRDPYKFYEFAVCALLKDNEPEKVRLLSKLMAKYRGRERHLINKLSARYNKEGSKNDGAGGSSSADHQAMPSSSAPSIDKAKSSASENMANKPSMSGMEKIHEGEDGEEEAGSSVLNDPSRANMAAIEAAKKKMESAQQEAASSSPRAQDSSAPQEVLEQRRRMAAGDGGSVGHLRSGSSGWRGSRQERRRGNIAPHGRRRGIVLGRFVVYWRIGRGRWNLACHHCPSFGTAQLRLRQDLCGGTDRPRVHHHEGVRRAGGGVAGVARDEGADQSQRRLEQGCGGSAYEPEEFSWTECQQHRPIDRREEQR